MDDRENVRWRFWLSAIAARCVAGALLSVLIAWGVRYSVNGPTSTLSTQAPGIWFGETFSRSHGTDGLVYYEDHVHDGVVGGWAATGNQWIGVTNRWRWHEAEPNEVRRATGAPWWSSIGEGVIEPGASVAESASGYPFVCLRTRYDVDRRLSGMRFLGHPNTFSLMATTVDGPDGVVHGFVPFGSQRVGAVMVQPIWRGLLLNAVIWAGLLSVPGVMARWVRGATRERRGACVQCGHSHVARRRCSECGVRTPRRLRLIGAQSLRHSLILTVIFLVIGGAYVTVIVEHPVATPVVQAAYDGDLVTLAADLERERRIFPAAMIQPGMASHDLGVDPRFLAAVRGGHPEMVIAMFDHLVPEPRDRAAWSALLVYVSADRALATALIEHYDLLDWNRWPDTTFGQRVLALLGPQRVCAEMEASPERHAAYWYVLVPAILESDDAELWARFLALGAPARDDVPAELHVSLAIDHGGEGEWDPIAWQLPRFVAAAEGRGADRARDLERRSQLLRRMIEQAWIEGGRCGGAQLTMLSPAVLRRVISWPVDDERRAMMDALMQVANAATETATAAYMTCWSAHGPIERPFAHDEAAWTFLISLQVPPSDPHRWSADPSVGRGPEAVGTALLTWAGQPDATAIIRQLIDIGAVVTEDVLDNATPENRALLDALIAERALTVHPGRVRADGAVMPAANPVAGGR